MTTNAVAGIDIDPVSQWLTDNIDDAAGPYRFEQITGGRSNLTFRVSGSAGPAMVLRRPPLGAVLATAHDMGREHRIISAVAQTSVPVPQALAMCEDEAVNGAPFYVMRFVDGVVMDDADAANAAFPEPSNRFELTQSVVAVLADLHHASPDAIGLGELGRKEAYLDRQLKRWQGQWEKSKTREIPEMDQAYQLLVEAKPEQRYTGIVHGDYRLGNLMVNPQEAKVAAVLDWELCTLGDVLADLGYLLNNWDQPGETTVDGATGYPTAAGGFGSREDVIAMYRDATGHDVSGIDYYRAFQRWRLAAIIEGVLARYLKGAMAGDNTVDLEMVANQVQVLADDSLKLIRGL